MREIKFRGYSNETKSWHYGYYASWEYEATGGDFVNDKIGHFILPLNSNEIDTWIEVIPESVGQLTGLKDKNGVEIYEGGYH